MSTKLPFNNYHIPQSTPLSPEPAETELTAEVLGVEWLRTQSNTLWSSRRINNG